MRWGEQDQGTPLSPNLCLTSCLQEFFKTLLTAESASCAKAFIWLIYMYIYVEHQPVIKLISSPAMAETRQPMALKYR